MAYTKGSKISALRTSLVSARSTPLEPVLNSQTMESRHSHAELQAAATLLLLAKRPIHWERGAHQPCAVPYLSPYPSVEEGPPQKRVRVSNPLQPFVTISDTSRSLFEEHKSFLALTNLDKFQADRSPEGDHTPTPALTRASSIETVESVPSNPDARIDRDTLMVVDTAGYSRDSSVIPSAGGADVQEQSRKRTFRMDQAYATVLAKHCRQPLRRLFNSDKASDPVLLKHAARATLFGRHTHPAGFVSNPSVTITTTDAHANTNANTNAISRSQQQHRKMDGFWAEPDNMNGFSTSMQSDARAVGKSN